MVDMARTTAAAGTLQERSVLVFDGDCGFCTQCAALLRRWSAGSLDVLAWQEADLAALGLTPAQCAEAVQLVAGVGRFEGGEAIGQALVRCRPPARAVGRVVLIPALAPLVGGVYRRVAANRYRLPGATAACRSDHDAGGRSGDGGQGSGLAVAPADG
jgi:predicted DCC family thiol-disulfide oxidoreductase YuxK